MTGVIGLLDHQVVQRRADGTGRVVLEGKSDARVRLRVVDVSGRPITDWVDAGSGLWLVDLAVPAGGPYDLLVSEGDREAERAVRSFLVGDLWILAGQSNMQGVGRLDEIDEHPLPQVSLLDMPRRWRPAVEPLHRLAESPDPAHWLHEDPEVRAALVESEAAGAFGAGLGVAFANALFRSTAVPVGLVATAHGGTSMEQWDPARAAEGAASLYGSLLCSLDAVGGRVAGVVWYQGESDANAVSVAAFPGRLRALVDALRSHAGDPDLPFVHVQLGRLLDIPGLEDLHPHWSTVREAQRTADLGPGGLVTAVDLGLVDPIHVDTPGLARLGRRAARVAVGQPGITIGAVSRTAADVATGAVPDCWEVRIELHGAVGALTPAERIPGFTLQGPDGTEHRRLFGTRADGHTVVVQGWGPVGDGDTIAYGWGLDPPCLLTDAVDQAVPAFGPLPLT